MKKRLGLVSALLILLFALGIIIFNKNRMVQFVVENDGTYYILLKLDEREQEVLPWYDEVDDLYYFFLPSCVKDETIYFDSGSDYRVVLNGGEISGRNRFVWKKGEVYLLELGDSSFQVTFMKAENLPAMFMDTESGSMEAIWADKHYEGGGTLTIVGESGNIQYHGKLDKISGRGNSTWEFDKKKPYNISLANKYPLCGLSSNRDWNLLSLCYEHDKIHSKVILDLAREIGLSSTPECTWVDLYCEGEYQGLYLLTEDVDSDYKNNTAGVLLEREHVNRLEENELYFKTSQCHYIFTFKHPSIPSAEQMEETVNYVQKIEDLIISGDDSYKEYIDMDSIAKQYLLDKIFMEIDAMRMSTFYYIDWDAAKFYAGPFWDYDRAVGLLLPDYTAPIEAEPNEMGAWYNTLYADPEFYQMMYASYCELLPYFERILQDDIDEYALYIQDSVEMDSILMKRYVTSATNSNRYDNWGSYVKYFKFFLAGRLNYLSDLWNVEASQFEVPESTGIYHDVYFETVDGAVIEKRSVLDGTCMEELPALDEELFLGWYFSHLGREYSTLRPVYEDTVLYAKPVPD